MKLRKQEGQNKLVKKKLAILILIFVTNSFAMVKIAKGRYTPFLSDGDGESKPVDIKSFEIDQFPVTNVEFNDFIKKNSKWSKSNILSIFSDENYLKHWNGLSLSDEEIKRIGNHPVTNISWFAAKAFCKSQGKRLPSLYEWEYASDADNQENVKIVLQWYGKTQDQSLVSVNKMKKNKNNLYGIHGYIWEWVDDYNAVLITNDSRNSPEDKLEGMFCGGGSLRSKDSADYAAFMRHAFRSGVDGKYTYFLLGFRCAK